MSQEASTLEGIPLTEAEFRRFQEFFQDRIGLHLSGHKKQLLDFLGVTTRPRPS